MKARIVSLLAALLLITAALGISVSAEDAVLPRFVDQAGLLSASDAASLTGMLDEISQRRQLDVVIVTVPYLPDGYYDIMDFADDIYDRAGYGFGDEYDGIILVLDMGEREWWISTCGYGITAFTDYGLEYLENKFLSYLSSGDYYGGFRRFASECDTLIGLAYDGEPLDYQGNDYDHGYSYSSYEPTLFSPDRIFGCLIFGLIIGLIAVGVMKSKHRSVRFNPGADRYAVGQLYVKDKRDVFLYKNTSKVPINNSSSSSSGGSRSGGSSTHHSSSGRSHGGRGGHF